MNISKREFLKGLGVGGLGCLGGLVRADEYVASSSQLPQGSCGDPEAVHFGRHIFPLKHTMVDGPSCQLQGGTICQPARTVPVFQSTDVLVVGGGPAGFSAAIAAARSGVRVTLIERYGSLGGLFTNGMVLIVLATSIKTGGKFRLVTDGVCGDFMRRAQAMGAVASTGKVPETAHWQPTIDPEAAKYLMDRMAEESKINVLFHCWGVDVVQDGSRVLGVVFESKEGRQGILAKQVVDCTGDADVLFQAGGDYRQITHAIGSVVRLGNVDRVTATHLPLGDDGKPLEGKWPTRSNEASGTTWWGGAGAGPTGNGLSVRDVTEAEIQSRKTWWEHVVKMRQTPGWEKVQLVNTCSMIGPRATRLIDAECIVDRQMYRRGERPLDTVAICGQDGPHSAPLYVPYRQLVPKKVDNLLCAGRCLGAGDTIDTLRLIAPCFATGHAAGVAAALASKENVLPRNLNVRLLQTELIRQGACLS